jgi:hypothetical protein
MMTNVEAPQSTDFRQIERVRITWPAALAAATTATAASVILAGLPPLRTLLPLQLAVGLCVFTAYTVGEMTKALTAEAAPHAYFLRTPPFSLGRTYLLLSLAAVAATIHPYLQLLAPDGSLWTIFTFGVERFHKLAVGVMFAGLSSLAVLPPSVRMSCAFVAVTNLAVVPVSLAITAIPFRTQLPDTAIVLLVAIGASMVFVCAKVRYMCQWAARTQSVDLHFGQPMSMPIALSSCIATFVCFAWFLFVSVYGALHLGLPLFVAVYVLSTALGLFALCLLRERLHASGSSVVTPFQLFDPGLGARRTVKIAAIVSIGAGYATLGYMELRLVYAAAAVAIGSELALLLVVGLLCFVVEYVARGAFWGSVRTDVIQLAHMGTLAALVGVLLLWSSAGGDSSQRASVLATASLWSRPAADLSWFGVANLMIGHAVAIFAAPDMWSRFALPMNPRQVRQMSVVSLVSLTVVALVSGLAVRAVLGGVPGLVVAQGVDERAVMSAIRGTVSSLDLSNMRGAVGFCAVVAAAGVALVAAMATLDTVLASWWQSWRVMVGRPWNRDGAIAATLIFVYVALLFLGHLPFFFLATFVVAATVAAAPMWVARFGLEVSTGTLRVLENASILALSACGVTAVFLSGARVLGYPQAALEDMASYAGIVATGGLLVVIVAGQGLARLLFGAR